MLARTHVATGLLLGLLALDYVSSTNRFIFIIIAVFSSLLPDVDQRNSLINRLLFFSKIFSKILSHRGFTHSILASLIGYLLFFLIVSPAYASAFLIGYISHLFADAITKEGVNFFYPFNFRISGLITTGSMIENVVFVGILVGVLVILIRF